MHPIVLIINTPVVHSLFKNKSYTEAIEDNNNYFFPLISNILSHFISDLNAIITHLIFLPITVLTLFLVEIRKTICFLHLLGTIDHI